MSKKQYTRMKRWASICGIAVALLLIMATAHAANTYTVSMVIWKGGGNGVNLVKQGNSGIYMWTNPRAADDYLNQQGLNSVTITANLVEEWIQPTIGSGYYRLSFTFGPSGCFFNPPLYVELAGKYVSDSTQVWMYNVNGEAINGFRYANGKKIIFEIPHFSYYSYDHYY